MPVILRYRRIRRGIIRHAALCALCRYRHKAHWSEPRLQYDRQVLGYAMCELVAEMSACFVASEIGIPQGESLENHASYLKSWLDQMRGDANFVFKAAKMASGTCDYLLSFVRELAPVG